MNGTIFGIGVALLFAGGAWTFAVAPSLLGPEEGASTKLRYEAEGTAVATLPGPMVRSRFAEEHSAQVARGDDETLVLRSNTRFTDLVSEELLFETSDEIRFHRDTLKIDGGDVLAFFPPGLAPADIRVKQFAYLPDTGVVFRFVGREQAEGVSVHRYDFEADGLDWTDSYTFDLSPQARIVARDWGTVWIEPETGTLVKHEEAWSASVVGGPYDGVEVDRGRMWLSSDTMARQAFVAENARRTRTLVEWVVPGLFVATAFALMAVFVRRGGV